MSSKFNEIYENSINNPEKFWKEASEDIFWFKKPTKILNKSNPPFYKWFEDGVTNTCYNALDIHIDQGRGQKTALIYDSPITGNKSKFTYEELRSKVSKFAGALKAQGANKGDRVIIYMPMIPEAVVAMLACARIGAIHSVVFGGFASNELASRIDDSKAKLLVTASSTNGLYSTVLPGSKPHDAVTRILALLSSILLASSFDANPPKTTECIAPILPQASIAMTASGIIGI